MKNWLPSLNSLRAFESVARHLSFQKAAKELFVTSAAVQQLVRKLEANLDIPLIRKEGRNLILTPAGEAGLNDLQDGFIHLKRGVEKIRTSTQHTQLKISVEPGFASNWLVERLKKFQITHENIDVLIESSNKIVDLDRGEADIAIRYGHGVSE